jgi:hypothetical protein
MRKTILTILGSALLAASTVQIAAAAEHHHRSHKLYRAPAPVNEEFRNSNAYYGSPQQPDYGWQQQPGWSNYSDWSRYQNGAGSAPAGQ